MKLLHRPSFYLAIVPVVISILAYFLHDAMDCGMQCTGIISRPIDFVARFIMYYIGFKLAFFEGLAFIALIIEVCYVIWQNAQKP